MRLVAVHSGVATGPRHDRPAAAAGSEAPVAESRCLGLCLGSVELHENISRADRNCIRKCAHLPRAARMEVMSGVGC